VTCGSQPLIRLDPTGEAWYDWVPVIGTIVNALTTPPGSSKDDYSIMLNKRNCKECPAVAEAECRQNIDKEFFHYLGDYLLPSLGNVPTDAILAAILFKAARSVSIFFAVDGAANLLISAYKAWGIYDGAQAAKSKCKCH